MEEYILEFLLYLDELLITGLSSLIGEGNIEGYIEVLTTKRICDKTLTSKLSNENKETTYNEEKHNKDKREGYKTYTNSDANTYNFLCDNQSSLEGRGYVRIEQEEKRIFTMFSFHRRILNTLQDRGEVRELGDVCSGNINEGDYVRVSGTICNESLSEYIDALKTIINCFGCDKLNKLLDTDEYLDFNIIDRFLNEMQSRLNSNDTRDLILSCSNRDMILTINNNFFLKNHTDKLGNTNCNIFGKVVKKCEDNDYISFLRKTGQQDFYEEMLYKCIPAFDCLKKISITPPKCPRVKLSNNPYQIVPISIYI